MAPVFSAFAMLDTQAQCARVLSITVPLRPARTAQPAQMVSTNTTAPALLDSLGLPAVLRLIIVPPTPAVVAHATIWSMHLLALAMLDTLEPCATPPLTTVQIIPAKTAAPVLLSLHPTLAPARPATAARLAQQVFASFLLLLFSLTFSLSPSLPGQLRIMHSDWRLYSVHKLCISVPGLLCELVPDRLLG